MHQVLKSNYQEQNTNRENGHLPVKLFTKFLQKRVAMQPPFRRDLNRPLFASATRVCSASVAAPEFQGPGQVKVMDKTCNFFAGLKFNWSKPTSKLMRCNCQVTKNVDIHINKAPLGRTPRIGFHKDLCVCSKTGTEWQEESQEHFHEGKDLVYIVEQGLRKQRKRQ